MTDTEVGSELPAARAGADPAVAGAQLALDLHTQARIVGAYTWIEHQLFGVLGSWVGDEIHAGAASFFDVHSKQHAWHGELFAERLPVLDGFDRRSATVAPDEVVPRLLELVGEGKGTRLRLCALTRAVLPRLIAGYSLHLGRCVPVADAPLARALSLVVHDELESWRAAEELFEALGEGSDPGEVKAESDEAAELLRHLDEILAGRGPGLVAWPGR